MASGSAEGDSLARPLSTCSNGRHDFAGQNVHWISRCQVRLVVYADPTRLTLLMQQRSGY